MLTLRLPRTSVRIRPVFSSALVALTLVLSPLHAQAGKLFLSGGAYQDSNTDLFVQGLRKATGKDANFVPNLNSIRNCASDWATTVCPRVAVVMAASESYAVAVDAYTNDEPATSTLPVKRGYHNLFQTHGFSPKMVTAHVDNLAVHASASTPEGRANMALLEQADVVWFSGGDQAKIIRAFLNDDGTDNALAATLRRQWNNGAGRVVIAGDSAGNHALNARMHGRGVSYGYLYFGANLQDKSVSEWARFADTREGDKALRYLENGATMKALGFLPAALLSDTHFEARSGRLGRLAAALRHIGVNQGLGVDIDTGVLIDTGAQTARVFGSGSLTVVDSSQASVQSGTYYRVNGLRVSLLTAGDSYHYATRTVTSSKPSIASPYYSGSYHSSSIFTPLEVTKSLTRLVDQVNTTHVGTAPVPVYASGPAYPSGSPVIRLRFTRDAATRGFYGAGLYTVSKAKVDIY